MKNSIIADLIRVQRKKSFNIMMIVELLIIIIAAVVVFILPIQMGKDAAFSLYVRATANMSSLMVGIPIFLAVFSDDFRSRAMQTAIGFGLSRSKLILARYIESFILILETVVYVSITELILGLIGGIKFDIVKDTMIDSFEDLVPTMCYFAICMIIVYASQSATFALVMFIVFTLNVLGAALQGVSAIVPFLSDNHIHLNYIMPEVLMEKLAQNPDYNYPWLIWIIIAVVYIILPILLAMKLFRKKELEF